MLHRKFLFGSNIQKPIDGKNKESQHNEKSNPDSAGGLLETLAFGCMNGINRNHDEGENQRNNGKQNGNNSEYQGEITWGNAEKRDKRNKSQ